MKGRRLAAALVLAAIGFACGRASGREREAPPASDWSGYDPAQLTWVAEGIMERISQLEDELAAVMARLEN